MEACAMTEISRGGTKGQWLRKGPRRPWGLVELIRFQSLMIEVRWHLECQSLAWQESIFTYVSDVQGPDS